MNQSLARQFAIFFAFALVLFFSPSLHAQSKSWGKIDDGGQRFQVLKNFTPNNAILDRETGLVWLYSSAAMPSYADAEAYCFGSNYGGRYGWRLPTIEELSSLFIMNGPFNPIQVTFPQGIPVSDTIFGENYFSSTSDPTNKDNVMVLDGVNKKFTSKPKDAPGRGWCVRSSKNPMKSWTKIDDENQRFQKLSNFHNQAVLDRETGLIWASVIDNVTTNYADGAKQCLLKQVDGHLGWRLPTIEELASVIVRTQDTAQPPKYFYNTAGKGILPSLPTSYYLTSTVNPNDKGQIMTLDSSQIAWSPFLWEDKEGSQAVIGRYWCVRGGNP